MKEYYRVMADKGRKEEMKGGRRRGAKEGLFPLLVQNPARSKK